MKTIFTYTVIVISSLFLLIGCKEEMPKAKYDGVTLAIDGVDENNVLNVNLVDRTHNINVIVSPENVTMTPDEFQYEIKDESIATVDENGVITMLSDGETKLTVRINVKNDVWVSCTLKVIPVTATGIIAPENVSINVGATRNLANEISVEPADASQKLNYQISDPGIATITDDGVLTGVSIGETTLTVSTKDGSNLSKSIAVSVSNKNFITDIQFPEEKISAAKLIVGQALNINELATILPEDAEDKTLKCSVKEGGEFVSVAEDGLVTCMSEGAAIILVEAQDGSGIKKELVINVSDATGWCDRSLWAVTASAPYIPDKGSGKPEDILDGDNKTFLSIRKPEWFANPEYNEIYFIIDTHGKATFNYALYEHRHENVSLAAEKIDISGSNDGIVYTPIKLNIEIPYVFNGDKYVHEFELPSSNYRYIKVQATSWPTCSVGGGGSAVQVAEFKLGNY